MKNVVEIRVVVGGALDVRGWMGGGGGVGVRERGG